jgi:hypothetical protein
LVSLRGFVFDWDQKLNFAELFGREKASTSPSFKEFEELVSAN